MHEHQPILNNIISLISRIFLMVSKSVENRPLVWDKQEVQLGGKE
jgi:hypothetical protein